ncbi:16S rRNA (cytidine(1402)-2'-O)-methyltransferase [Streptomyces sp. 4N509B]|uniref:16S rRNA (cytidine(1402)-2'-O)-methyltransferase n=1 Tax=Streptomyces sp. 4N509B TaxID=3457413 RepID=UPI003FD4A4D3
MDEPLDHPSDDLTDDLADDPAGRAGEHLAGSADVSGDVSGTADAPGVLVLAGRPAGDAGGAPARLGEELAAADVVAGDPELLRELARALDVPLTGRVVAYGEAEEDTGAPEVLGALRRGARVLLLTDAGSPSAVPWASGGRHRLVAAAVAAGARVTAVPWPSPAVTALAVSGLPVDRFCVEGTLPSGATERAARLAEVARDPRTLVFHVPAGRLPETLGAVAEGLGGKRRATVCGPEARAVWRGTLADLAAGADADAADDADAVGGSAAGREERLLVVAGAEPAAEPRERPDGAELARRVAAREAAGERRKEAIAAVARDAGLPKRQVYDAVVAAKDGASGEAPDESRPVGRAEGD